MQVEEAIAFAIEQEPTGLEIRVNFGVFAGRDATTAELEELGKLLDIARRWATDCIAERHAEVSEI